MYLASLKLMIRSKTSLLSVAEEHCFDSKYFYTGCRYSARTLVSYPELSLPWQNSLLWLIRNLVRVNP